MSGDGWNDRNAVNGGVSEAYRAAAFDEAPPEDLDRAVLAHARRTAARRRLVPRPLHVAWAAVMTLCVVIVLDVATPPEAPPDVRGLDRGAVEEAATAPEIAADQALETRQAAPEALREFSRASRTTAAGDDGACGEQQRATPDAWLDCIAELSEGSERDEELAAFRARHPERELPARLTAPPR